MIIGTDWQPIETAPKDGTQVLLWDDNYKEVCAAKWNPRRGSGAWVANGTEDNIGDAELTHWKPVPSPPRT